MGQGSFFSFFFFFSFSFDEYYYEEKVGWNDLAFLSFFFFFSLFFWFLELKEGEWDGKGSF